MMKQSTSFAQGANKLFLTIARLRLLLVMFLTLTVCAEVWGAEGIYKTALFGTAYNSKSVSSYTDSWSATNDGFTVNLTNANNNNNGWSYIKMGRSGSSSTGTITTAAAIDKAVTKVTLTIDAITSSNVTSITLKSATIIDGTYTSVGTFTKSKGTQTVTVSSPKTNLFYQIEVACTSGSSNGLITISQVDYYADLTPTATYDVSWVVNGEEIDVTEDISEGSKVPSLPAEPEIDCSGKVFVGWSDQEVADGNKPSILFRDVATSPSITKQTTFYAVFAESGGSSVTTWSKTDISAINDGDEVVVVMNNGTNFALYDKNGTGSAPTATSIIVSDNLIASPSADITWVIGKSENSLTFYQDNTRKTWLYCTATNNGVRVGINTNKTFTIDASSGYLKNTGTSRYLGIYKSQDWRCYTETIGTNIANQTLAFYAKTTTTGYQNYTTTCTTEPSQLAIPENLKATNITSTSATLSWNTVTNATGYKIKTGNSIISSTDNTSYDLSGLEPSTEYTYCVYAFADDYTDSKETCVTFTTAPAKVVNWMVKGVKHTTEFNGQSTTIYQPTGDELTCGEKKFVGWTANSDYENKTVAPNDLFTTTLPNGVTEGTTFHAVYADTHTTTTITYTWDLLTSTSQALAVGDQIVIAAKDYDYALSTTQNTDTRGAVAITKDGNSITINNNVQIFTIETGNEESTFALATGNGYLSGTRRKAGNKYYEQLTTATSKASANASWYIDFTEEKTPYIYNEVSEKNGKKYEYPNYYVGFNYNYNWWTGEYTYDFKAVRDASTGNDYNPKNISIYRSTKHENTTTVNSGYTTDCGCSAPTNPLAFSNQTITAGKTLTLAPNTGTGNGGTITYTCSDATHTTINGNQFSADALGTYEITATQGVNDNKCGAIVDFTVTVECATPSITPTTYKTTTNTPVDLKSVITSTSTMPLTFACTDKNVYISGTNFTFLAAGTYTITATQEAGGIYCDGSQKITITVTDPCAGKTKPNVTATAITTDKFTLSWSTIAEVSVYRVYNNTTGDSDETTATSYTFSGLNPSTEYSWTVEALYSDGCTAATSGTTTTSTPVVEYAVNWNVAGNSYTTGTPTTSVNHGEKVSALPTAPDPAEHSCGDKVFVGWSKSQYLDGTRLADLFTTAAGSPAITAATTFYAVFADCVTGGNTPGDDTQGEYTLVTDVNDLQKGDKIIIACYSQQKAASELTSDILSVDADVTFGNNGTTLTPSASTLIFTLGGSTGAWTFANSSGQLLGATAVKKLAWDGGTTTWRISISGNDATLDNITSTYGDLQYNAVSPRFTTYTSSQTAIQLYKKTSGGETPEPEEYTVTLSVLGETSEENTTSNYTLPIDVDAACVGKTFVGWTTTENLSSSTEPTSNYWAKGTPVTIKEDKIYYAVFADGTNTFEWVTTGVKSGADYLLAGYHDGNDYVLKNTLDSDGYIKTDNINAIDNVITTPDNSLIWTIAGNSTLGYYIYNPASNKYLNIENPFSLDGTAKTRYSITMSKDADNYVQSYIKYGNDYCCLYDDNTIGIDETEASIYLYKRTYTNFSTTCDGGGETPNPNPDPEPTGNEYVKVTDASSLKVGDKLLLVNESNKVVAGDITSQYMAKVDATISNNTISELPSGAVVLTLGGSTGAWTFANSSGQLLGVTAVKKLAWDGGTTTWRISISNGDATIQNGTDSYGRFLYNMDNPRFTTYTSDASASMLLPQIYKFTSTPASAPARQVAMKRDAAKAAKKAGMARPITRIAPAALAAQECTSYENYTTNCCANPITDLKYSAGANSITLYWNTAAASATATLYSDEACKIEVATQSGITNGTCTFTGLAKTTTYYAKVTTDDGCTAVLEVSTERPHVSVAEWAANQININVNTNEPIKVVLENEVTGGGTSANQATELFFSKYYEATGNVKLVAVYNGTANEIDLTNYKIKYGKTSWAADYISLKDFGATKGKIASGEEIILYSMNWGDSRDVAILDCVIADYPDGTWVEVTTANNTGKGSLSFAGDKSLALFNGNTMIDIIGGGTTSAPNNTGANTKPAWGDAKGWTCDEGLSIDDGTMIGISTNRCLLVRNNTVTSGDNAVNSNTTDFTTLCTEWKGAHVPDDEVDDGVSESCENFEFVGTFDYSDYYVKYEELGKPQALDTEGRKENGTYLITVPTTTYPKGLHDLACTNMRISIKDADDNTLVTQDLKVPIIIDQDVQTNNKIYFQYPQRDNADTPPTNLNGKNENILTPEICADCDVVIRDNQKLIHVAEGVSEFNNMMVYPGAKFDNSASQKLFLNTLQMQGKNDEVSYAIINNDGSTIDVGDMVFVKRIDDQHWYQFSLPYDCKVSDIIQQDGQSMGKYWVDWGIKYYNGKRRQAEGTATSAGQVSPYWEKVEETATLKAHQGYIIGLFTTEWNNQMKSVYFTPVTTNPYRESGDDAKTTQVESWYIDNLQTVAPRHRGWNFTGSPYISIFNPQTPPYYGESSVLMSGTFDPANPDAEYTSGDVYLSIPVLPDGLYYNQVVASSTSLMPFRAYFVQTIDPESTDEKHTLTYVKAGRQLPSAPARTAATKQRVLVELNITAPDGQTDNTGVWVDERYTTDYEIAADLTKMYVAGTKPQLYTLAANNEKLAYNALPDDAATNVPIELYAPLAGDYTLTLNNRVSRIAGAESIELLHDGQVVANLLIQDYTIAAPKGTVKGYSLRIHRRANVSTALDNTTGSTITLIANDGYITLLNVPTDATISIYDMVGRLIDSQHANGETVVNMPIVPQGVYNIVVANGNGHTTIKSVIR